MHGSRFNCAVAACGALVMMASSGNLTAAELRLLAGGAMTTVWAELKPKFEDASGHKLNIFYRTSLRRLRLARRLTSLSCLLT
jgi:ABC-type molybdate transport system substrate-binding protein